MKYGEFNMFDDDQLRAELDRIRTLSAHYNRLVALTHREMKKRRKARSKVAQFNNEMEQRNELR